MRALIAVGAAGFVGAVARYGVEGFVTERTSAAFPWGTLVVNVTGCFVLGFLFSILLDRVTVASWLRSALMIGFVGAYTTFSTFSLETFRLIGSGSYLLAAWNAVGSLVLGLVAVYGGTVLGRVI